MTKALPVPQRTPSGTPTQKRRFVKLRSKIGHASASFQRAKRLGQTEKAKSYKHDLLSARAKLRRQKAAMAGGVETTVERTNG